MEEKLYLKTLKNFESLYESKENYDVIIKIGKAPNIKEIYAHSLVLCYQSSYFRTALSSTWAKKEDGKYVFNKHDISSHIFEIILRYLYCGKVNLNFKDESDILKLLVATDEFGLVTLNEYIQEFLVSNRKEEFLQNDLIGNLDIIFQNETFRTLQNYCLEIICRKPYILFGTDKILELSKQLLELLLDRDDLNLEEVEIWNDLIKWAHAQRPTIDTDPYKWNSRNSTSMKKTTSKLIPLIRFQDITSKEFSDKVLPYEDLLPKKLKHDILNSYLNSNSTLNTDQIVLLPSRIGVRRRLSTRKAYQGSNRYNPRIQTIPFGFYDNLIRWIQHK